MDWVCFQELPGFEKSGVMGTASLGGVLIIVGIVLLFRRFTRGSVTGEKNGWKVTLPLPLGVVVVGAIVVGIAFGWVWKKFPEDSLHFGNRPWTLEEVKARVERESEVRVDLQRDSSSFKLTKEFSGACGCQLIESICSYYQQTLKCEHPEPLHFIVAKASESQHTVK